MAVGFILAGIAAMSTIFAKTVIPTVMKLYTISENKIQAATVSASCRSGGHGRMSTMEAGSACGTHTNAFLVGPGKVGLELSIHQKAQKLEMEIILNLFFIFMNFLSRILKSFL